MNDKIKFCKSLDSHCRNPSHGVERSLDNRGSVHTSNLPYPAGAECHCQAEKRQYTVHI